MSQRKVYEILKELGGEATTGEVRERAKEKYPKNTLHMYASDRLHKLSKWGIVKKLGKAKWKIVREMPPEE